MYCVTCRYRTRYGVCVNKHIHESGEGKTNDDDLVYSYQEGGGFSVGPFFGCVHYATKWYVVDELNKDKETRHA